MSVDPKLLEFCVTETQRQRVQAVLDHGNQSAAADALGVDFRRLAESVAAVKKRAARAGWSPEHDLTVPVADGFKLARHAQYYDKEGKPTNKWVIQTPDAARQEELMRAAVEAMCSEIKPLPPTPAPKRCLDDLMSVYPFGDPHFGMYSWAAETGADFDLSIAEADLCAAVDYLVDRSPPSAHAALINLGDFFHAENMDGITTKSGNVLDMDTRFPMMIDVGVRALRRCIARMLEKHQTVEMINAPGNHDETMAFFLSVMFRNLFENEPRITVRDTPTQRHYIEHGKCLIGVVHGHRTKDGDLPGIMATEMPQAWGRTRHRYYYRGHHHHDERREYNGCIVEQFRTLAAGDAYAVGTGYLSGRDMKCIVMHKEYGEQSRFTCGIDVLRET